MARDPEGNLISPKLRADQQEVNSLYAQLPTHAEQGKQELERLFASGHERRDAGQTAEARERFVAAYLLARELTFAAGEAEALTLAATCTLELGELTLGVEQMEGSRKLHAQLGNADGEAEAQCNLGLAHAALGELQRAQQAYRQSLRLARHQPLRLTRLGLGLGLGLGFRVRNLNPSPIPSPIPNPNPNQACATWARCCCGEGARPRRSRCLPSP